jgi:hypothetical protein
VFSKKVTSSGSSSRREAKRSRSVWTHLSSKWIKKVRSLGWLRRCRLKR